VSRQAELGKLNVVAGILRDGDGRVLITERLEGGAFQGMWEFPGGKISHGEQPVAALVRELREEIGVVVRDVESLVSLEHRYPDRHVAIEFFLVNAWEQEPQSLEGQRLKWIEIALLDTANLLPADVPVIRALQGLAAE
jgi:8-oxo-dGTP diphosphatase